MINDIVFYYNNEKLLEKYLIREYGSEIGLDLNVILSILDGLRIFLKIIIFGRHVPNIEY